MNEINKNNLAVRNTLYARTLGTLEILYNGEPWELPMSVKGKVMQLFLLLIWAGENGISRVKLQDFLYDRRSTDAANALRITTTRLRKILSQSVLPLGEYVVVEKNTYYLKMGRVGGELELQMDAALMEDYYNRAMETEDEAARQLLLEQACRLYGGEFLPVLSGEVWAESLRSHYQDIYFKGVREACRLMKLHRDHQKIVRLCDAATAAYPLAEWAEQKIGALLALKRYGDALKTYDYVTQNLLDETGSIPPDHVLAYFKQIGSQIEHVNGGLKEIRGNLEERDWSAGSYYCTYPGFVDCFRMVIRSVERGKRRGFLIVCTVRDGKDCPVEDGRKLQEYEDALCEVVHSTLRRGDVYTKYGPDQILILANELREDKCRLVENRIVSEMRRRYGQKVSLHIENVNLKDWCPGTEKGKEEKRREKTVRRRP
ncbi:AfsR/SARP family transcriptional regulator [Enterocloster bolteae]|uniref:AfsR/SARP family transcriptional regulator n=1 Tax=Enterocloster bolteae TaxID=208479 RepID=UPI003AF10F61